MDEIPQTASKRSPKSRPDHTSATINDVSSKVGGIGRPSLERANWTRMSNAEEKLVLYVTQRRHCSQMLCPYT